MATPLAPKREIFGWAMFDFANSAYTTVIVTVVYSVIFPKLIVGDAREGNLLWSIALSISYALVVLTAPILGAVMDYAGHRKRWLAASWLLTVIATASLYFATPGNVHFTMVLLIASNFGFAVGESFTASFLPGLGPPSSLGKISGAAWGLGYFGGLVSTAAVLAIIGAQTVENFESVRLIGPITAAFFFVGALPTFLLMKERAVPKPLPAGETWLTVGFSQLRGTLKALQSHRDLMIFFGSFFFAMAGLSIVISFAFIYGDQVIHWQASTQTLMFVITQLTAAAGALAFGYLQGWLGDLKTYGLTLIVWVVTVLLIGFAVPISRAVGLPPETFFLIVGCFAGACLGSTQSAARTVVAVMSPADRVGEFFGLWGLFGKLAAIVGLLSLGFLQSALGLENAILVCAVFFLAAFAVVQLVKPQPAPAR
ncbi:MAG: MFS transporter [Myxococcales bacterium]|nr:MFS transporter [Myxococcales bacterium]